MFRCHVCGSTQSHTETIDEVFQLNGNPALIERIPALICDRCGETTFSRETTERIRRMVQNEIEPVRTVEMSVYQYS